MIETKPTLDAVIVDVAFLAEPSFDIGTDIVAQAARVILQTESVCVEP